MATIDILLIGGGGAGGWGNSNIFLDLGGAGGGAGGYRYITGQEISSGTYPVIIGSGGTGTYSCILDPITTAGGDTTFSGITASGGGIGGGNNNPNGYFGTRGGCGGGSTYHKPNGSYPNYYGAKGFRYNGFVDSFSRGGSGGYCGIISGEPLTGGGGGGAGQHGAPTFTGGAGGVGGNGIQCPMDSTWYSGGGGGGGLTPGSGGTGGGGTGGSEVPNHAGYNATYYGGGGGGGYSDNGSPCGAGYPGPGGNGYQGLAKIRYITSEMISATGGSKAVVGIYTIHTFTSNDNFVINVNPVASPTPTPVASITPTVTPTSCINYPITIILHDSELDAGPFDLYSNVDDFTVPFETGVSRDLLLYGFTTYNSPCFTKIVQVMSNGYCITSVDLTTTDPYPTPNLNISTTPTPTITRTPTPSYEPVLTNQQGIFTSGWYKVPENVYFIQVEAWGAGGGGSGASAIDYRLSGGGGGGGAYAKRMAMAVTPLTYYYFNVGAGGETEQDGTYSSFTGDTEMVLASGGHSSNSWYGGIGAYSGECIGDIIYSGGTGGDGDPVNYNFCGGGGGGSPAADHYNGLRGNDHVGVYGGDGATSRGGHGGDGGNSGGSGQNGVWGGGGGGAGDNDILAGTGGQGYFVVSFVVAPVKPDPVPYLSIPSTITESGWYKIPIGIISLKVECRAIGGEGGRPYGSVPGGGGSGGAYAKVNSLTVIPDTDYLFIIGTTPGSDNEGSFFVSWYSPAFVVGENNQKCLAGCGQTPMTPTNEGDQRFGQIDNCIGDVIYLGGIGGTTVPGNQGGGGGGEGAGSTSNGGNGADGGAVLGGAGGSGTDGGNGGVGGIFNGSGGDGLVPGGAGGGAGEFGYWGAHAAGQIDVDF